MIGVILVAVILVGILAVRLAECEKRIPAQGTIIPMFPPPGCLPEFIVTGEGVELNWIAEEEAVSLVRGRWHERAGRRHVDAVLSRHRLRTVEPI